ncbi:MAG: N-acetyltransferase [Nitrospirae bacterium]|nr:N-acetyltransferase [Nitrospirota bacterium]
MLSKIIYRSYGDRFPSDENIQIVEVKSKNGLDDFIKLPFKLYSKDPLFVPPLFKDMYNRFSVKNPFFLYAKARYFLAKKGRKTFGRVTAIVNSRHNEFHRDRVGFFGFFESINNFAVARSLLDKVSEVLRNEGMDTIRGPMNFSTNEECGFLLEGFNDPPVLMTPYNPPYYNDFMQKYGMKKIKDLYAYICEIPMELPEKVLRVAEIAEKRGIRVRPIDMRRFELEMRVFKDIYNSAWQKNWGFIPITIEETNYLAKRLKPIVLSGLILIAYKDEEPVGFMGVLPDINFVLKKMRGRLNPFTILKAIYYSKKIRCLRLLLLGIKSEHRNKGVDALLFREGFKNVKDKYKQFHKVEFSWILEDNIPVQRLVEMIGARLYKIYRVYEKNL